MLFAYNKKLKKISLYKKTDLKSHKILERQDIEKWVENYPDVLGEDLLILTTEYDKFDKTDERLDLLAIDRAGTIVIIELKRDDSGKNVELQAIKYAAYCSTLTLAKVSSLFQQYLAKKGLRCSEEDARDRIIKFIDNDSFEEISDRPRIIIVSKEFRTEVTATVIWLRKFGVDITCIKITPYEVDKHTITFESNILIPLPEAKSFIVESEKKEDTEHKFSLSQQEYLKFYQDVIDKFKNRIPNVNLETSSKAYCQIPTGISSVHFEWGFHGRPRSGFGVELHFEKGNKEFNEKFLNTLRKLKTKIEKSIGEKVVFQKDWGRTWARLYIKKDEGRMTNELKNWAVTKMEVLYKILQPELEKIRNG